MKDYDFFLQWYILVVYSTINASNWLSLTFSKVQLQKFCNFYTSLDGLMSKTICIRKLCAIENKINEDHLEICWVARKSGITAF